MFGGSSPSDENWLKCLQWGTMDKKKVMERLKHDKKLYQQPKGKEEDRGKVPD